MQYRNSFGVTAGKSDLCIVTKGDKPGAKRTRPPEKGEYPVAAGAPVVRQATAEISLRLSHLTDCLEYTLVVPYEKADLALSVLEAIAAPRSVSKCDTFPTTLLHQARRGTAPTGSDCPSHFVPRIKLSKCKGGRMAWTSI
jgi:hypothetical protein